MLERRSFDIEFRGETESRKVEGYASVFNSRSKDLGGFTEIIDPAAFEGVIERSDVLALLNHDKDRGVLARSRKGVGSLSLTIDERGLLYSFDAPNTALGNELIEGLKRGDISTSSFAFTVSGERWDKNEDGSYTRTITQIDKLFDVSPVYNEAYEDTTVALRSLDELRAKEEETEDDVEDDVKDENKDENIEEKSEETEDNKEEQDDKEVSSDTEEDTDNPVDDNEEEQDKTDNTEEKRYINNNTKKMGKFSLIKTINDIVNNRSMTEEAQAVLNSGVEEMRKAGLSYSGQIQLPVSEMREAPAAIVAGQETYGAEVVATEKLNILEPLRNRMVLAEAGATYLTGLVGNVSIPSYSGSNVGWKGELVDAEDGKGTFDSIEFSPKRLTAYIDVSKQFLAQDSVGAEEMLYRDIVNAIADKLEATILGNGKGDNNTPAGIFNEAAEKAISFTNIVDMEKALEEAKLYGDYKFIASPAAKAALKTTTISGQKSDLRMLMEGNEVNGYEVLTTGNCSGIAFGKWDELVIAQWGSLDIIIDPYTQAKKNAVRIVVNAFFDAKPRRSEAIVKNILPA
jgi:HK97 family phage prohead protease/HK97 family phage major capsid protein